MADLIKIKVIFYKQLGWLLLLLGHYFGDVLISTLIGLMVLPQDLFFLIK